MTVAFETLGADLANSRGTAIIGGLNAMGSWVSLGTTTIAAKLIYLFTQNKADTGMFAFHIGTGASPSVLIGPLLCDQGPAVGSQVFGPFPCNLASGTEISVQAECDSTAAGSETVNCTILVADEPFHELSSHTYNEYGVTLGVSLKGTTVDPGATANTEGAYSEIVASAAADIEWILFTFGTNANAAVGVTQYWLLTLARSSGPEIEVIQDIPLGSDLATDMLMPRSLLVPGNVFAGQRIAAKARCSITDATDRIITVQALAVSGPAVSGGGKVHVIRSVNY